jgi:hypothetical protein
MADGKATHVLVVVDYVVAADGNRVVLRGVFPAGRPLPPELAGEPPAGVTRNVAWCDPGHVVEGSMFRSPAAGVPYVNSGAN